MLTSNVTTKGQLTLPVKIRKELEIKPYDRVVFVKKNGDFVIQKLPSIDSLFGSLANPEIKPLTVAQMNKVIEKGMFGKNDRA